MCPDRAPPPPLSLPQVSVARDGPEMITLPTTSVLCCDNLKAVCVDEVDACFHEQGDALKGIFAKIRDNAAPEARPQTILVGATLDDASAEFAASHGILRDPVAITIGKQAVPKTLTHRCVGGEGGSDVVEGALRTVFSVTRAVFYPCE